MRPVNPLWRLQKNILKVLGKTSITVRDVPGFATSRLDLIGIP
jgi:3-hydroxyacyl-CoA dehydrogenase